MSKIDYIFYWLASIRVCVYVYFADVGLNGVLGEHIIIDLIWKSLELAY